MNELAESTKAVESRHAKLAMAASFLVTAVLGCTLIFRYWHARGANVDGVLRCITYVCAMVALHVWGYQAYRRQFQKEESKQSPEKWATPNGKPVGFTSIAAVQAFFVLFASLILDGGNVLQLTLLTVIVYWSMVVIIRVARRGVLTRFEVLLFKFGFLILLPAIVISGLFVWRLKGLLR